MKVIPRQVEVHGKAVRGRVGPEHAVTGTAEVALITDNGGQSF